MAQTTSNLKGIELIQAPDALLKKLSDVIPRQEELYIPTADIAAEEFIEDSYTLPSPVARYIKDTLSAQSTNPETPRRTLARLIDVFHNPQDQAFLQALETQRLALESEKLEEKKQEEQDKKERQIDEEIRQEEQNKHEEEAQVKEAQAEQEQEALLEGERQKQEEAGAQIHPSPTAIALAIALTKNIDKLSAEYIEVLESVELMQIEVYEIMVKSEETIAVSEAIEEWEQQTKESLVKTRINALEEKGVTVTEEMKVSIREEVDQAYKSPTQRMAEINAKMNRVLQDATHLSEDSRHAIKAHDIRNDEASKTRLHSLNQVFSLHENLDRLIVQHNAAVLEVKSAQGEIDQEFKKEVEVRVLYGELSKDEADELRHRAEERWIDRNKRAFINASKGYLMKSQLIGPEEAEARLSHLYKSPMQKVKELSKSIEKTHQELAIALPVSGGKYNEYSNKKKGNLKNQTRNTQRPQKSYPKTRQKQLDIG